jgi:VWFA-related protein
MESGYALPSDAMRALLILVALTAANADGPLAARARKAVPTESERIPQIRANVDWVRIPVSVTDATGAPVQGLNPEDFELRENGSVEHIREISVEDGPVAITFVFDASGSMKGKLAESREALRQVFHNADPGDEYSLIGFSSDAAVMSNFTSSSARIEQAAAEIRPGDWTALYDGVYLALQQARKSRVQRRAIILLSDGADNNSRYSEAELRNYAREIEAPIYSISLPSFDLLFQHRRSLRRLVQDTGGTLVELDSMKELPDAMLKLSRLIRHQYLLHYVSSQPERDGLYRKVDVRLAKPQEPNAERRYLYWRRGYYAAED